MPIDKRLEVFVEKCLERNTPRPEIEAALREAGWPVEQIRGILLLMPISVSQFPYPDRALGARASRPPKARMALLQWPCSQDDHDL
ncbi:MAG: hypothetical protein ACR2HF_02225, partial [Methylococcaceae bacterium]